MRYRSLLTALSNIVRPPFDGLAVVVWLYFVWCFVVQPDAPIHRGDFIDPDDMMILQHVIDWLKGQSWFDITQYRLDPPHGVPIYFSRITELPVAALILAFHALGLGWQGGATVASALWAPVLFGFLLATIRALAKQAVPDRWAEASAFIAIFSTALISRYTPGHVDHHGLAALITALAVLSTLRMTATPERTGHALAAGFFLALGQVIALETLPWLLILSGWIGVWMIARGRVAARAGLVFGLALYLTSAALLVLTIPSQSWLAINLYGYSFLYVLLTGLIALCCASVALATFCSASLWVRIAVGFGATVGTATWLLVHFPNLLAGPYGGVDPALVRMFFDNISEASPMLRREPSLLALVIHLAFPLIGFNFAVRRLSHAENRHDVDLWLPFCLLILGALLLSALYQVRFLYYAELFSIVPLTAMLYRGMQKAHSLWRGRALFAAEIGLVLVFGPLFPVLVPAMIDGRPFNKGVLAYPVIERQSLCDTYQLEKVLNAPGGGFGDKPRTIMTMMNEGPPILFRTQHKVIAGAYHANVQGNLDSVRFFTTHDPDEAHRIARAHKVDLVLACRLVTPLYLGKSKSEIFHDLPVQSLKTDRDSPFVEQLMDGKIPAWLQPMPYASIPNFVLFVVKPEPPPKMAG